MMSGAPYALNETTKFIQCPTALGKSARSLRYFSPKVVHVHSLLMLDVETDRYGRLSFRLIGVAGRKWLI